MQLLRLDACRTVTAVAAMLVNGEENHEGLFDIDHEPATVEIRSTRLRGMAGVVEVRVACIAHGSHPIFGSDILTAQFGTY